MLMGVNKKNQKSRMTTISYNSVTLTSNIVLFELLYCNSQNSQ